MKPARLAALSILSLALPALPAMAQEPFKIGVSVGLSGYAAAVDRGWRDGLEIAAAHINGKGGVLGRKIELVVEDNKSEPQEAVTIYRKMIGSDKVGMFISGCVSAGNFAAAPFYARAKIPAMLCSILPPQPEQVAWSFSFLPPPRFEVEKRYGYLKDKTQIRTVGILHDPTPYANLQKDIAVKEAAGFGIQVPAVEEYRQDDADLSNQISKTASAGGKAIIKIGLGGSTLTAAKNIKQLGQDTLLMGSIDDLAVWKPAGEVLGPQFLFVASPAQVYDSLPEGSLKQEIARFLPLWRAKHGDRDPMWAGKGWDALMFAVAAIEKAQSFDGAKIRDAAENVPAFQGTGGIYKFSQTLHQGITENPFFIGTIVNGRAQVLP
ncbi:ABC transporter substrate-binding protein [Bosea sp. F3-2]|uniref:ABC transporter substrate-binding protein n=1 Tax=Bosea sp. F3-2 TaxID=2599640 RepID=UPI0011EF7F76|nr:ABC transporter substrate-binding protein [Bosea sp. F3-2]QEL22067.1 ABC transporter substrate-binding protein [Bosea sp. F3-2]